MHVILGATGQVGSQVAEFLLDRGEQVTVVSRHPEKLDGLKRQGANPLAGSLKDPEFLSRAFTGARSLFSMIPPQPYARDFRTFQTRVGASIASAIAVSGVTHVVNLSSVGAEWPAGTGPITGLHEHEERLNALPDLHVLHLRPAFFMENLLMNIDLIKANGVNGSPLTGELDFPVIATRDIAWEAANRLQALDFSGHSVQELLGERDLSMHEMTRILGNAIGLPSLKYVRFSYEETVDAMIAKGISPDVARLYNEMCRAFNEGRITHGLVRTERNTTRTPFEEFARFFSAVYKRGLVEVGNQEPQTMMKR